MSEITEYRLLQCPVCAYVAGIHHGSPYGVEHARGSLVAHLCRQKHALARPAAKLVAADAAIMTVSAASASEAYRAALAARGK